MADYSAEAERIAKRAASGVDPEGQIQFNIEELLRAALAAVPPQDGPAWYARAVKARNALIDAVKQLRGGHSAHMDACDLAFAELDIVLGLAPYRTVAALAAVETPQAPTCPRHEPQVIETTNASYLCLECGHEWPMAPATPLSQEREP